MFQVERHAWLIEKARNAGRLDVTSCSTELGVTVETIRRDLNDLEEKNLLRRVHGGAIPVEGSTFEFNLATRKEQFVEEKRRIAYGALEFITDAETLFWDEGYTPQLAAEVWQPTHKATVVTNALQTASILAAKKNVEVIFLGGRVRSITMATSDAWAIRQLSELVIDQAVIGTNGISLKNGCTTPSATVSATKTAAMKASHSSILLVLSNRFGSDSFVKFADVSDFTVAITDNDLEENTFTTFTDAGLKIKRV